MYNGRHINLQNFILKPILLPGNKRANNGEVVEALYSK